MILQRIGAAAFAVMICISIAAAEEQFGVPVYPGAAYDLIRSGFLAENKSIEGAAYRTDDSIAKVKAFYEKQGLVLLKFGSPSKSLARFKDMDRNVDVVVQSPWKDPQTGKTRTDTLILIMKEKQGAK